VGGGEPLVAFLAVTVGLDFVPSPRRGRDMG